MARKARRRGFGKVETKTDRHGRKYFQASYPTPVEAFATHPGISARQYQNFDDETMADGWLSAEKRLIDSGAWTPLGERKAKRRRETITFGEYAPEWVETRRRADGTETASSTKIKRRELLKNHLLPTFGKMRLVDITPAAIDRWLEKYPRDSQSAYNAYTLLKPIMQSAATDPIDDAGHTLIGKNPCTRSMSRPPKKHKTVVASLAQLKALYDRMPERIALTVYLGGALGLRIGEILALRRQDVDIDNRVIHINATLKPDVGPDGRQVIVRGIPKTRNSIRDIPIPESLVPMIAEHLAKHTGKSASAYLFTGRNGTDPMWESTYNNSLRIARAGIPGLELYWSHDGRHDALSRDAELGASNALLMALGGHADIRTVSVYQDASSEAHQRSVIGRLDAELARSLSDGGQPNADRQSENNTELSSVGSAPASPPSPGDGGAPSQDDGSSGLAAMLAVMPLDERMAVLRELDAGKRQRALGLLPRDARVETMAALFEEEL